MVNLRPISEIAPLIHTAARRLEILDDTMVLVTCCATAEVLRRRGLKTGVLVQALIDAAVNDELAAERLPTVAPQPFTMWGRR